MNGTIHTAESETPRKLVKIARRHRTGGIDERTIIVRCLPHDTQPIVGKRFRYGSGRMWNVLSVEPFSSEANIMD